MANVSIATVAEKAGVSVATVSRVINHHSVVKTETAKRVTAVIQRLGYKPGSRSTSNPTRMMGTRIWRNKKVLYLWTGGHGGADTLTGHKLQEGATAALQPLGVNLLVDYLSPGSPLPPIIESGELDGILLNGPAIPQEMVETMSSFPAVWLLYQGGNHWGDRIQPNHRGFGEAALNLLVERGCTNVAVMSWTPRWDRNDFFRERADAFEQFARLRSLNCHVLSSLLSCCWRNRRNRRNKLGHPQFGEATPPELAS